MDGLDEMIKSLSATKEKNSKEKVNPQQQKRETDNNKEQISKVSHTISTRFEDNIQIIMSQVRGLLLGLSDEAVREKMNNQLAKLKFDKFMEYYNKNSHLSEYTIHTELERMEFKVIYNMDVYTEKQDITKVFKKSPSNILWRLANQSVYAELILCLQSNFPIQELNLSVTSNRSSFIIDIDSQNLICESVFLFQSINHSMTADDNRLFELADIRGIVQVSLSEKQVFQYLQSPSLRILFDDKLREIAENIAILQGCANDDGSIIAMGDTLGSLLSIRNHLLFGAGQGGQLLSSAGETALAVGNGLLESVVLSVGHLLGAEQQGGWGSHFPAAFPRPERPAKTQAELADDAQVMTMTIEEYLGGVAGVDQDEDTNANIGPENRLQVMGVREENSHFPPPIPPDAPMSAVDYHHVRDAQESQEGQLLGGEGIYVEEEAEVSLSSRRPTSTGQLGKGREVETDDWDDWD